MITPDCVHILTPADDDASPKALAEALDGWGGLTARELPDGRVAVLLRSPATDWARNYFPPAEPGGLSSTS